LLFWKDQEKRLRLFWRVSLQGLVMVTLLVSNELLLSRAGAIFNPQATLSDAAADSGVISAILGTAAYLTRGLLIALSIWLAGRFFDRRQFSDFGFRFSSAWWSDFIFGFVLGAVLMTAIFLLELGAGWVRPTAYLVSQFPQLPFGIALLLPLLIFLSVGFYEELFTRGYLLTNLAEGFSALKLNPSSAILAACLISSVFFGYIHSANPDATLLSSINIGLAGIFLATGFLLTGELAIPIGLHISWNFFQGSVFGFPVSGWDIRIASLIQTQQSGPPLLTGGSFGPEGGLLGTFFSILGIALIIIYLKLRTGKTKLQTSISLPPDISKYALFQDIQHVIWDWNGTLLDDLELSLDTINSMLISRNLNSVSKSTYLAIFGFPVKDYYLKLGFDFSQEPFEEISTEFITSYENGRSDCLLMEGATEMIDLISRKGLSQSILSASKMAYLKEAVTDYNIDGYFSLVDGLDNHHAAGKLSLARDHLAKLNLDPRSILLIGDTLHDAAIAAELGFYCCLIPNGHHSRRRLEGSSAVIVNSLQELKGILQSSK